MSALPPKADIGTQPRDVRFVPVADMLCHESSYCVFYARNLPLSRKMAINSQSFGSED
jgi:hypothetical protein